MKCKYKQCKLHKSAVECFFTPLDFLIIFTNRYYQVCLGICRMHWQFKARNICKQATDVLTGKPESLKESNTSFPATLPVFPRFLSYVTLLPTGARVCFFIFFPFFLSRALPLLSRCDVSEERAEAGSGAAGWLEDPIQLPGWRLRGCHALHVHWAAFPPPQRAGHPGASQHRERPNDSPPSHRLPGVPGFGPLHGFRSEWRAPPGLGEATAGGAATSESLRAGHRLLRGGEHGAMVSCAPNTGFC